MYHTIANLWGEIQILLLKLIQLYFQPVDKNLASSLTKYLAHDIFKKNLISGFQFIHVLLFFQKLFLIHFYIINKILFYFLETT